MIRQFIVLGLLFAQITSSTDYTEKYRPQFHYTHNSNVLADPVGFYRGMDGNFNLFYLHTQKEGEESGTYSWGHAMAKNLVFWKEQDLALEGDKYRNFYLGSIVVDLYDTSGFSTKDPYNLPHCAIYTLLTDKESTQNLACSVDNGVTWEDWTENPLKGIPHERKFVAPRVFWYPLALKWIMVLTEDRQRKVHFYQSFDLKSWTQTGEFSLNETQEEDEEHGLFLDEMSQNEKEEWKSAELFPLKIQEKDQQKWILLLNLHTAGFQGGDGSRYLIGTFDGNKFILDQYEDINTPRFLDYGQDFSGLQTIFDFTLNPQFRTGIASMNNNQYFNDLPTEEYRGQLTFPRDIYLRSINDKLYLFNKPNNELAMQQLLTSSAFVYEERYMAPKTIKELNQSIKKFMQQNEDLVRIWVVFNKPIGERNFGMRLKSNYNDKYTEVGVDMNMIYVNRENSGNVDFNENFKKLVKHQPDFDLRTAKQVDMEIVLDKSSVEVFFFEGMYSMTNLIFPDDNQRGIEIFPDNDDRITIKQLWINVLSPATPYSMAKANEKVQRTDTNTKDGKKNQNLKLDIFGLY